jgi:AcrR family transcriptional regulator
MNNNYRGRSKSEEKRLQILDAASSLFLENGFEGVSMDNLATAAGVSKQTVYSHFGSKEELFAATVERECEKNQLTDQLFNTELPISSVLKEVAVHYSELLLSDNAVRLHRICVASAEQRSAITELFWSAGPQKLFSLLRNYLDQQVIKKNLTIDNTDFAAQQFLFMVKGEAHLRKILGLQTAATKANLSAYFDSCVSLFLSGYQTRKTE